VLEINGGSVHFAGESNRCSDCNAGGPSAKTGGPAGRGPGNCAIQGLLIMRLNSRFASLVIASLWCKGAIAQSAMDSDNLSFAQVVRTTLEQAPSLTAARSVISMAEAQKLGAVAAFLPTLSLSDQTSAFTPVVPSGNSVIGGVVVPSGHGYSANVASANLGMNLFAGGKDVANFRASLDALRSANAGLNAALDTTLEQLITDFTAVCIDQVILDGQGEVLRLNRELVDLADARIRGRVGSQIDLNQARLQMLQAQTELIQARQQRTNDLEKLFVDIGLPRKGANVSVQEWIPNAPSALDDDPSVNDDPAVLSALDAVKAAQSKVNAARAEYSPTVALSVQYNYLGIDPSSVGQALRSTRANNYSVGLSVTVPIFPLLNAMADVGAARANVESAKGRYQGAIVSAANRIADASDILSAAQEALEVASAAASFSRRNLELTQDQFSARQADKRDVDNARVAEAQAAQAFSIAQLNARLAAWEKYCAMHGTEFPTALLDAISSQVPASRFERSLDQ
jgi:outer membrane protein TolC